VPYLARVPRSVCGQAAVRVWTEGRPVVVHPVPRADLNALSGRAGAHLRREAERDVRRSRSRAHHVAEMRRARQRGTARIAHTWAIVAAFTMPRSTSESPRPSRGMCVDGQF